MRFLLGFALLLSALFLTSCSSSRLTDADRVFETGDHRIGSVIDSDVLVPADANLSANYLAGSRVFVQSGGSLSGLSKGGQRSTVFAEEGADVSGLSRKGFITFVPVDDAEEAFRNRFRNLLPAGARSGGHLQPHVGGTVFAGGYFGSRFYRNRGFRNFGRGRNFNRSSRSVSVRPRSYRSRN